MEIGLIEKARQSQEQSCHILVLCFPSAVAKKWPIYFLLFEEISMKSNSF